MSGSPPLQSVEDPVTNPPAEEPSTEEPAAEEPATEEPAPPADDPAAPPADDGTEGGEAHCPCDDPTLNFADRFTCEAYNGMQQMINEIHDLLDDWRRIDQEERDVAQKQADGIPVGTMPQELAAQKQEYEDALNSLGVTMGAKVDEIHILAQKVVYAPPPPEGEPQEPIA